MNFKPLLASQVDNLESIKYPVYVSPKLDGIRSVIFGGVAYSRSMKPIPNKQIQQWASDNYKSLEGVDGEFIVGSPTSETVFRDTTSFVMSHSKIENFSFYVFDLVQDKPYNQRLDALQAKVLPTNTKVLPQDVALSNVDLERFRAKVVEQGYEGAMVRSIEGKYKQGRSSVKEGILLKLKLFKDAEYKIVGYDCKYHNTNEAVVNELGRTSRSTSKDGLIPTDTLGVLYLVTEDGTEFGCGSGFDDETRKELWDIRDELIGQLVTVKYFDVGGYSVPRFPVFKGIRSIDDTGE